MQSPKKPFFVICLLFVIVGTVCTIAGKRFEQKDVLLSNSVLKENNYDSLKPTDKLKGLTRLVVRLMSDCHYLQMGLTNEMANKIFNEYLILLDPNKVFFTEGDVDFLSKQYLPDLANSIKAGNLDFAFTATKIILKRVADYRDYALKVADEKYDYATSQEEYEFDRKKLPWAKDENELKDLWRKRTVNELLTLKIAERARLNDRNKENDSIQEHDSWHLQQSPAERVKKRIQQIDRNFKELDAEMVVEQFLSAVTTVYDPHSQYMLPKTQEEFDIGMGLELVGIGAELTMDDGYIKITRIIAGGPADRSKLLKETDRIVAVGEENKEMVDLIDMPLNKAVSLIRGKENTIVHLTVLDGAKGLGSTPKNITLTRSKVVLTESEAKSEIRMIERVGQKSLKIGVITLPSFYYNFEHQSKGKTIKCAYDDVLKLLKELNKESVDGIVFDLRSNGGGALIDAIRISGLFIRLGPIVQTQDSMKRIAHGDDKDQSIIYDGPLVLLVNKFSASATEILAGAMQDYKRAIIVGDQQTYGKGTVQDLRKLDEWGALFNIMPPCGTLKYTTAKFYRVNGESTQLKGVKPDLIFPSFSDVMETGEGNMPYALPFDSVKPMTHDVFIENIDQIIVNLREKSDKRMKDSQQFDVLKNQIQRFSELKNKKTVSLNEAKRWTNYLNEVAITEQQLKLMNLDEKLKNKESQKQQDLYLDETLQITADFVHLLNQNNAK